jgi:hypothetical protein
MKDMVSHFKQRWKSILAVTVFCTVLLGGWQFFSVKKAHDAGGQTKEEARYEQEMAEYQEKLANAQGDLDAANRIWTEQTTYRDNSILLNLDPDNVWIAEKKYLVSSVEGSVEEILAAYTGTMTADHDEAAISEAFGTDNAGFARELVSITADPVENSFTTVVRNAEKEKAEKGLAYVAGKIAEAEKIAQTVGSHTLQGLNEGCSRSVYPELMELQADLARKITKDEEIVTNAKRAMNNVLESKPFKPGDPVIRWAITGAVLGFLLMVCIYLTTFLRKKER